MRARETFRAAEALPFLALRLLVAISARGPGRKRRRSEFNLAGGKLASNCKTPETIARAIKIIEPEPLAGEAMERKRQLSRAVKLFRVARARDMSTSWREKGKSHAITRTL